MAVEVKVRRRIKDEGVAPVVCNAEWLHMSQGRREQDYTDSTDLIMSLFLSSRNPIIRVISLVGRELQKLQRILFFSCALAQDRLEYETVARASRLWRPSQKEGR